MKWYASGAQRSNEAVKIIESLLEELNLLDNKKTLTEKLISYKNEISAKKISIPLILNRMNLEISSIIKNDEIKLSDTESTKLKKLMSLSNIKY